MKHFFSLRQKPFSMIVVLILIVALVVGCSSSSGGSGNDSKGSDKSSNNSGDKIVTIKFTQFSGAGDGPGPALEKMRQKFEDLNPTIKVDIETIGYGEYFTQMQTRVSGGTAPDAYELNYENFVPYAKLGVLENLEPYFAKNNFDRSSVNEMALAAFSDAGNQYGMPASFSNVLLIYNKELFDQANINYPTNDWTWKELNDAASKIRALGDNIFGISQGVHFFEFFKAVQQNNGSLFNDDMTKFTVNTPANLETLKHLVNRIQVDNSMPTEAQMSGLGDWDLFKAGRLGMILTGVWAFPEFSQTVEFEWDIAIEPGNTKKATHFFSNGYVINKDSKNKDAAYKWVEFMSSSREAAQIRIEANWELPAVTYPDVLEAYLKVTPPANKQAVFDSLDYLVPPPVITEFGLMGDIITKHLGSAAQGAVSPEDALAAAQKELESQITLD